MADFEGASPLILAGQTGITGQFTVPDPPDRITAVDGDEIIGDFAFVEFDNPQFGDSNVEYGTPPPTRTFGGFKGCTISDEFFEKIYVLPRSVDLGIILSTQTTDIDVYNAYRDESRTWLSYDDSTAGADVTLTPTPPPPSDVLAPQSGATYTLTVGLNGPPTINGDLVFEFDTVTITVPITGTRTVLFPFQPEVPVREKLQFLTDIIRARTGKEQRRALRKNPRVVIEMEVLSDDSDRRLLNNLLFDGQARAFGVPLWWEASDLTADLVATDTQIQVADTTYMDLRTGGVVVVWESPDNFEALQVSSFTSTTINLSSPFTGGFSTGALVMPVRSAITEKRIQGQKYRINAQTTRARFTVLDNDIDIADVSAFSSYQPTGGTTRVLLDDPNAVAGLLQESWNREFFVVDNGTSAPEIASTEEISRRGSSKTFVTTSKSALYNVRRLLHALRGRQVSFYLPTFFPDLKAVVDVAPADQAVDVEDNSYVDSIQSRQPGNVVRIVKTDGTMSDPKLVTGASKPSAGVERISIAPDNWGITATTAQIDRIEFIEKVRFNSDEIVIQHENALGYATITAPVLTVLEEDDA